MITKRMIFESAANVLGGRKYYNLTVIRRLDKNKEQWNKSLRASSTAKKAGKIKPYSKTIFCLSFDLDEKSDIDQLPWLLKLLKKYKIKASFAAVGKHVEQSPEIFQQIIKEGHELINHTYTHPDSPEFNKRHFHKLTTKERFYEIKKCHDVVQKKLGYTMKGFRVPHFGHQFTKDIYPMLKKLNYDFSSSAVAIRVKNGGYPYIDGDVWEFPVTCCPRHPYCIFDTSHAFRAHLVRHTPDEYLDSFLELLKLGSEHSMFLNIYQDPQDLRKFDYEKMLKIIKKADVEILTYGELVKKIQK
jgi:peptidoglycan-N-acetylglucosamine deacetylase